MPGNTPKPKRGVVLQNTPTAGVSTAPAICKGALSLLTTTADCAIKAAAPMRLSSPAAMRGVADRHPLAMR
jgi:hypothetical protein